MALGLVGQKRGMTRVFTEDGVSVPVTVIEVMPNRITQIKTCDTDGYAALQVTTGAKKSSRVNKPEAGHFARANVEAGKLLREFRVESTELENKKVGDTLTVEIFQPGQSIDVQGISKGKGFSGVVKRHNFSMQPATHGNSLSHRAPGSTGQRQTPGRVFKGKKMAGHLGDVKRSAVNQKIVQVDKEMNCILVKGAVPGAINSFVFLRPTVKNTKKGAHK